MTTHDNKRADGPDANCRAWILKHGNGAPRLPEDRPAESRLLLDDGSSPDTPNSLEQGRRRRRRERCRRERTSNRRTRRETPPGGDVQPSGGDVQPSGTTFGRHGPTFSRRVPKFTRRTTNCFSPRTLPGCGRGGMTSRRRLSTILQIVSRRQTRSSRRSSNSSRQRSLRRARGSRGSGHGASIFDRGSSCRAPALSRVLPASACGLRNDVGDRLRSRSNRPATEGDGGPIRFVLGQFLNASLIFSPASLRLDFDWSTGPRFRCSCRRSPCPEPL